MGRNLLLFAETAVALTAARLALAVLPFARLTGLPESPGAAAEPASGMRRGKARRVRYGLARVAPRLPWHSNCLTQVLAGCWMLRRRRTPGRLCIGVTKGEGGIRAHAWLMAGDIVVCGGDNASLFTPIAGFSSAGSRGPAPPDARTAAA